MNLNHLNLALAIAAFVLASMLRAQSAAPPPARYGPTTSSAPETPAGAGSPSRAAGEVDYPTSFYKEVSHESPDPALVSRAGKPGIDLIELGAGESPICQVSGSNLIWTGTDAGKGTDAKRDRDASGRMLAQSRSRSQLLSTGDHYDTGTVAAV